MNWNESTRLALVAAVEMAQAGEGRVTAADLARRHRASGHHVAKVLQRLARAGLARAARGVGGGYRLARPSREVTLYQIVELFESRVRARARRRRRKPPSETAEASVRRVLAELEDQALFTLQSIRLSTLAGR